MFLVHELSLRFLEPVECIWGLWVLGFVGMDEEGLDAIAFLDIGFGDTWLEIEDCIGI
jgi:hypothetical protein